MSPRGTNGQRPRRSTLRSLRKAALASTALCLSGLGLAAVMALPFGLKYQFEIAYAGFGAAILGVVWQDVVLVAVRRRVPIDSSTQTKIRKRRWSAGPFADLTEILMLTEEGEASRPARSDPSGGNLKDHPSTDAPR